MLLSSSRKLIVVMGVTVTGSSFFLLGPGSDARSDPNEDSRQIQFEKGLREAMRNKDTALAQGFTVVLEMRIPAVWFDPAQGSQISKCTLTSFKGVRGLTVESRFEKDAVYQAPGTRGYGQIDFDEDQNLIVWRSLRKSALSAPDINRAYDEQQLVLVSPNGEAVPQGRHNQIYEYSVGSEENIYEFYQFRLATGRGFMDYAHTFKSTRALQNDLVEVFAEGVFGPSLHGEWRLLVDSRLDYLVREATFQPHILDRPAVRVRVSGEPVVPNGASIGSAGSIAYDQGPNDQYEIQVTVLEYSTPADQKHLEELRHVLTAGIPKDAEVVDYSGSSPVRYSITKWGLD